VEPVFSQLVLAGAPNLAQTVKFDLCVEFSDRLLRVLFGGKSGSLSVLTNRDRGHSFKFFEFEPLLAAPTVNVEKKGQSYFLYSL